MVLAMNKFMGFFREIGEILQSDVEFKDLKIAADPIELGIAIKQIPGARAGLRKLLEDRLPRIYDLVNNEILKPARKFLYDNGGYNDILIIVDQLDRIPAETTQSHYQPRGPVPELGRSLARASLRHPLHDPD